MSDIYEETADIFMSSLAGQMSGMSRDQLIAHFKRQFPSEAAFKATVDSARKQAETILKEAQASLSPGQVLAFGYAVDEQPNRTVN